jgi:glycosyltransferase involved in cell wall biosynthesis
MNNKIIWYLNPWDALPNESGFDRSLSIIKKLSQNNFNVVWWNTNFSHAEKKFRENTHLNFCELILLPGISYKSNTGIRRLLSSILLFSVFFQIKSFFKKKPNIIFLSGPILFIGIYVFFLKFFFNVKVICELRDLWPEGSINQAIGFKKKLYQIISTVPYFSRNLIFRLSDYNIFLNQKFKLHAENLYPFIKNNPSIISLPSPIIDFNKIKDYSNNRYKKDVNEIWAIFSGTLGDSHNQELVLNSLKYIKKPLFKKLKIFFSGDGHNRDKLSKFIKKNSLKNIYLTGYLDHNDYLLLLKNSDFGLSFYHSHSPVSFPTKVMDYINAELPVIMSGSIDAARVIENNNCGIVIRDESESNVANEISKMCDKNKLNIFKSNLKKIANNFSSENQIDKIVNFVNERFN